MNCDADIVDHCDQHNTTVCCELFRADRIHRQPGFCHLLLMLIIHLQVMGGRVWKKVSHFPTVHQPETVAPSALDPHQRRILPFVVSSQRSQPPNQALRVLHRWARNRTA